MKVTETQARRLFTGLGFKMVSQWTAERLQQQLSKPLSAMKDEADECEDKEVKTLYKKLVTAQKDDDTIELDGVGVPSNDKKPSKKDKSAGPAGVISRNSKKDKSADPDDDDDPDDDNDDDEDEVTSKPVKKGKGGGTAVATKPKKKDKKTGSVKGAPKLEPGTFRNADGVIASIVGFLKAASKKKPLSKKALHDKMIKKFPERSTDSLWSTINIQVPSRLGVDKGIKVQKSEDGYWID